MQEVEPNGIYTTAETQEILKVSSSTMKRLLKRGILNANKVGGQYRILGREILRSVSPRTEKKAARLYGRIKQRVKAQIKNW